jgi:hypothetical protein
MYVSVALFVTEGKLTLCFCKFKPQYSFTLFIWVYTGQTNYIYRLLDKLLGKGARGNCMYANVTHVVSPVRRTCVKLALRKMAI